MQLHNFIAQKEINIQAEIIKKEYSSGNAYPTDRHSHCDHRSHRFRPPRHQSFLLRDEEITIGTT